MAGSDHPCAQWHSQTSDDRSIQSVTVWCIRGTRGHAQIGPTQTRMIARTHIHETLARRYLRKLVCFSMRPALDRRYSFIHRDGTPGFLSSRVHPFTGIPGARGQRYHIQQYNIYVEYTLIAAAFGVPSPSSTYSSHQHGDKDNTHRVV